MIRFRSLIYVGREIDVHRPENNLADPQRPPTNRTDQLSVIGGGLAFIIGGVLEIFQLIR